MKSPEQKAAAYRKRLNNEFDLYAEKLIKIRPKVGDLRPLIFNPVQKRLNDLIEKQWRETGRVRVVVLKARQQGLSTWTSGYMYWHMQKTKSSKGLVVAHTKESAETLFAMYHRIHQYLPEVQGVKHATRYSGKRELTFRNFDTGMKVATAGGSGVGRGETINFCHASEMGFWDAGSAADNWNAILQTVPAEKSVIIVESTANGLSGVFYDLWRKATDRGVGNQGSNGFIGFFSPWFESPEYAEALEPGDFEDGLTYEENDLLRDFPHLTREQLKFRRKAVALAPGGIDQFEQEYPHTPESAFKASGRPVFGQVIDQIHKMRDDALGPLRTETLSPVEDVFEEAPWGELAIFHEHDPNSVFTIGADVSLGSKGGDYSVAQVLDGKGRQVAIWRGHIDPKRFAFVLETLGKKFVGQAGQPAKIAVENNSFGYMVASELREMGYPNLFTEVREGSIEGEEETRTIGFRTTSKTKAAAIARLIAALREGELEINDEQTLSEMLTYTVVPGSRNDGMEAQAGCHDDCVMSLAIAVYVHERVYDPLPVGDEWYINAI